GLALIACGFVFRRIPFLTLGDSGGVRRNTRKIAFRGSDHPITPVFSHERHPVPGPVDGSSSTRRLGRPSTATTLALGERDCGHDASESHDGCGDSVSCMHLWHKLTQKEGQITNRI